MVSQEHSFFLICLAYYCHNHYDWKLVHGLVDPFCFGAEGVLQSVLRNVEQMIRTVGPAIWHYSVHEDEGDRPK